MWVVDTDKIGKRGEYNVRNAVDRVLLIASIVRRSVVDPCVRKTAEEIVKKNNCFRNQLCQIKAIFDFVKRNVKYLEDIYMIDTYKHACDVLKSGVADCDDYTILLDSLLASIGFPVGARIISSRKDTDFHHIYALVIYPKEAVIEIVGSQAKIIDGKAIPLDPTIEGFNIGDEVPYAKKRDFIFLFD